MSEERTQDIGQKYDTKPTIETLLEEVRAGFASLHKRMDGFDTRLDRIESLGNTTRGEMLALRADFRDLRDVVKDHFPEAVK